MASKGAQRKAQQLADRAAKLMERASELQARIGGMTTIVAKERTAMRVMALQSEADRCAGDAQEWQRRAIQQKVTEDAEVAARAERVARAVRPAPVARAGAGRTPGRTPRAHQVWLLEGEGGEWDGRGVTIVRPVAGGRFRVQWGGAYLDDPAGTFLEVYRSQLVRRV